MNCFREEVGGETSKPLSNLEVALGFIDVANEAMCRPIRALTEVGCLTIKSSDSFDADIVAQIYRVRGMTLADMC